MTQCLERKPGLPPSLRGRRSVLSPSSSATMPSSSISASRREKVDPVAVIYLGNLYLDDIADRYNILDLLNALDIKLADVYKGPQRRGYLDKCAEFHKSGDRSLIERTDLRSVRDNIDNSLDRLTLVGIKSCDKRVRPPRC